MKHILNYEVHEKTILLEAMSTIIDPIIKSEDKENIEDNEKVLHLRFFDITLCGAPVTYDHPNCSYDGAPWVYLMTECPECHRPICSHCIINATTRNT